MISSFQKFNHLAKEVDYHGPSKKFISDVKQLMTFLDNYYSESSKEVNLVTMSMSL